MLVARPLWFDEIFTAWVARLDVARLFAALRLDSGPPGFYLLEKPFAALGGPDWLLRLPSFLAALALAFGARTLPRPSRPAFLALVASSTLITMYAAEARPYAVLGLLGFAAFLLANTGPESARRSLALALVAAAALYTHYLAIIVVAALLASTVAGRRFRSAAGLLAAAVAFLPWLSVLRAQPPEAIAWMREPAAGSFAGFLSALGGVGRVPAPFGGPAPGILFAAGVLVGLLLLGAAGAAAFGRRDALVRDALLFTGMVLAGALLIGAWRPIAFAGRTEMTVLPVWIWCLAQACRTSRAARWGCAAAAALGIAGTIATVVTGATLPLPGGASGIPATLSGVTRRGDVVVAAAGLYLPLRLEAERGSLAAEVLALPEDAAAHPGWFVPALPGEHDMESLVRAATSLPAGGRLFLVLPPAYATRELVAALETAMSARGGRVRELARGRDALVMLATPGSDLRASPSGP